MAFTRFLYIWARPQKSYTQNQWGNGGNICFQTKLPLKCSRAYDFIYGTQLRLDYSNINFGTRCNFCSDFLNKSGIHVHWKIEQKSFQSYCTKNFEAPYKTSSAIES